MPTKNYYTLITSLPHLAPFSSAEHLPINRVRLDQRLHMLDTDHAAQLSRAEFFVVWLPTQSGSDRIDIVHAYRTFMQQPLHSALREYVEFVVDQRTILSALRIKESGLPLPQEDASWAVGRWSGWIKSHWDDQDFGLKHMYPWTEEAREMLRSKDVWGLETLRLQQCWNKLTRIGSGNLFGFEAVVSFYFRWHILNDWLAHDAEKSKNAFRQLVNEVIHEKISTEN
jgi:hypothetical protein